MSGVRNLDTYTGLTGWSGEVNTFADLPLAADWTGKYYMVTTETGLRITFNKKYAGLYYSDGATWTHRNKIKLLLNDAELVINNNADPTKLFKFDLSQIDPASTCTAQVPNKDGTLAMLDDIPPGGGQPLITMGQPEGDNIASTGISYIGSSGRTFFTHSGTGTSTDECAFSFKPKSWASGAKVWVDFTTPSDGVNFVVYQAKITVNNGGAEVSETITFTKVLSDPSVNYQKLSTEKKIFSSAITDILGPDSNVTIKIIRNAGHADDNDNSTSYTEFMNFDYNY